MYNEFMGIDTKFANVRILSGDRCNRVTIENHGEKFQFFQSRRGSNEAMELFVRQVATDQLQHSQLRPATSMYERRSESMSRLANTRDWC